MRKYKVGVLQINTQENIEDNLKKITQMVEEAAKNGANLVTLPENMNQITNNKEMIKEEVIPGRTINLMSDLAKKHKIWIHCGSIKEHNPEGKPFNTTVVLNPEGEIAGKYRKLHLFDVELKDGGSFKESDKNSKGSKVVNIDTEMGNMGLSICYDIRFPELYRLMTLNGAEVIFVPANFTYPTGKAHWSILMRARAIENGTYVVATGQVGQKPNVVAYGHSMIVDPWGNILAEGQEGEEIIYGEIDLDNIPKIREQIPSLSNRRADVYNLSVVD